MSDGRELVASLRRFGAEATAVEAKLAQHALPKTVLETLSSFSNTPGGGTIILGLDEANGFAAVGVDDAQKLTSDLASWSRESVTPPLQPTIEPLDIDGRTLLIVDVPELSRDAKPCYVTARGMDRGSYIRVGESDRRLTSEEVQQLIADRGQPRFDHEVVTEASLDDLDPIAVDRYLERLRNGSNARLFKDEPRDVVLRRTRITALGPDQLEHPTLGGLLALGRYPQQFFPQLDITFVAYADSNGAPLSDGTRFLDNASIDGSIPAMAAQALAVIQRNMKRRAVVTGAGRLDVWDYPPIALREAIINALVHRDLSPGTRGNQVQIEMYPDRLRIANPGGLYGAIDITLLGDDGRSSARNASLLKILEDVQMPGDDAIACENRGSGIRTMLSTLRDAGMSPPVFKDATTTFDVVLPNHTLLDAETVTWLKHTAGTSLTNAQCIALALMRRGDAMDNARFRAASGITDSRIATQELQDLVARELVVQTGLKRGARYTLAPLALDTSDGHTTKPNRRRQILHVLQSRGERGKAEISEILALNAKTTEYYLRLLKAEGLIESTQAGRSSPNTKYRLTPAALQGVLPLDEQGAL